MQPVYVFRGESLIGFFKISAYTLKIQLFLGGTSFQGTMDKLNY